MSQPDVNSLCNCYRLHLSGSEACYHVLAALCLTAWVGGLHTICFYFLTNVNGGAMNVDILIYFCSIQL